MFRTLLVILMVGGAVGAMAQAERGDSLRTAGDDVTVIHDNRTTNNDIDAANNIKVGGDLGLPETPAAYQQWMPQYVPMTWHYGAWNDAGWRSAWTTVDMRQPVGMGYGGSAAIFTFGNGGLFASMDTQSMPGLMGVESGQLSLQQQLGRWTITGYGEAVKYGYFGRLVTSYGFGGSLSYRIADNLSLTIFGNYYTSPGAVPATMAGYMRVPTFGGYVDYSINDKWGVMVGAQSYRSVMTGRREVQPIVAPYYRISKKATISVDVGGILYQVVKSAVSDRHGSNPTIAPPVP